MINKLAPLLLIYLLLLSCGQNESEKGFEKNVNTEDRIENADTTSKEVNDSVQFELDGQKYIVSSSDPMFPAELNKLLKLRKKYPNGIKDSVIYRYEDVTGDGKDDKIVSRIKLEGEEYVVYINIEDHTGENIFSDTGDCVVGEYLKYEYSKQLINSIGPWLKFRYAEHSVPDTDYKPVEFSENPITLGIFEQYIQFSDLPKKEQDRVIAAYPKYLETFHGRAVELKCFPGGGDLLIWYEPMQEFIRLYSP